MFAPPTILLSPCQPVTLMPVAADMAKAGESISSLTGLPQVATSAAFSLLIGAGCALLAPQTLDKANTVLVGLVIASFLVSALSNGAKRPSLQSPQP